MRIPSLAIVLVCLVVLESHFHGVLGGKKVGKGAKILHGGKGHGHGHAQAKGLRDDFYEDSCPQAIELVRNITWSKVKGNSKLPAKLLRLHFHDCFVRGCDASVLLDQVTGKGQSEKQARPNLSLTGFEVIDEIKAKLEQVCPGKVSCADIVALSARDAVSFQYKRDLWAVPTGRRDGVVSLASEANADVPGPFANFTTLKQLFGNKSLNVLDLVALSGAHTIGVSRCGPFSLRLHNFTGKGDADPALDAAYAVELRRKCPNPPTDPTTTVEMDPRSSENFDNHYYQILTQSKGLFQSDAVLLTDKEAGRWVERMKRDSSFFFRQFAASMVKMGAIDILLGDAGEIRKDCRVVN